MLEKIARPLFPWSSSPIFGNRFWMQIGVVLVSLFLQCVVTLVRRLGIEPWQGVSSHVKVAFQPAWRRCGVPWEDVFGRKNLLRIEYRCSEERARSGSRPDIKEPQA